MFRPIRSGHKPYREFQRRSGTFAGMRAVLANRGFDPSNQPQRRQVGGVIGHRRVGPVIGRGGYRQFRPGPGTRGFNFSPVGSRGTAQFAVLPTFK